MTKKEGFMNFQKKSAGIFKEKASATEESGNGSTRSSKALMKSSILSMTNKKREDLPQSLPLSGHPPVNEQIEQILQDRHHRNSEK